MSFAYGSKQAPEQCQLQAVIPQDRLGAHVVDSLPGRVVEFEIFQSQLDNYVYRTELAKIDVG